MLLRALTALTALLLAFAGPAEAQPQTHAQTRWTMATAYPEANYHTQAIRGMLTEVEAASHGALGISLHSNASLMPLAQIKRAVQTGQAQMGEVLLGAYGNEDPLYEMDFIPFLADTWERMARFNEVTVPALEARMARQGLTLLYVASWPSQAFYAKSELRTVEDLRGARFRAQSPIISRMAELLGATPVTVQAADVPQAFATGLANAMITSGQTGVDSAAWDYCRYVYDVGFTLTRNAVFVNTRAFQALTPELQAAFRTAAASAAIRARAGAQESETVMMQRLRDRGMVVGRAPESLLIGLRRIGDTQREEWAQKAGPEGRALLERYLAAIR